MISALRKYTKSHLIKLKDLQKADFNKKIKLVCENYADEELPFAALFQLIEILKGFLDSFTRYKSVHHYKRDENQFYNGLINIGQSFSYLVALPYYWAKKTQAAHLHATKGNVWAAVKDLGAAVIGSLGLIGNFMTSMLRGFIQTVGGCTLGPVASAVRSVITYKIYKAEKPFQENNGTKRIVSEMKDLLKNNDHGSQARMLVLLQEADRKLKKAVSRHQPLGKAAELTLNKDLQILALKQTGAEFLTVRQHKRINQMVKDLQPSSEKVIDYRYKSPSGV